jgi:general secretion pathway protein G
MVVVVIIAILATVVVPSVMNRPEQARVSAAKSNIKVLESAVKMYKLDNTNYPTTDQGLQALVEKPGTSPVPANWNRYIDRLPADPWGREFLYLVPGKHGEIDIFSPGPNGRIGDEDDIGSWDL